MKYVTEATMTLWEAVQKMAPDSSKTTLREWIRDKRIHVDGNAVTKNSFVLNAGQTVTLTGKTKDLVKGVKVLFEDPYLLAINKPPGLLSVSTETENFRTAHAILHHHYNKRIYVVHRLDQDTSGVMLFAFSEAAQERLKDKFAVHDVVRTYSAIVEGEMTTMEGTWSSYLYEDENYMVRVTRDPEKGEKAVTHFKVDKVENGYTWLTLNLETGRKNQIRVHCKAAGHPVAGDSKYGATTDPLNRLCLHAKFLSFEHPMTRKRMTFETPVPWDKLKCIKTRSG